VVKWEGLCLLSSVRREQRTWRDGIEFCPLCNKSNLFCHCDRGDPCTLLYHRHPRALAELESDHLDALAGHKQLVIRLLPARGHHFQGTISHRTSHVANERDGIQRQHIRPPTIIPPLDDAARPTNDNKPRVHTQLQPSSSAPNPIIRHVNSHSCSSLTSTNPVPETVLPNGRWIRARLGPQRRYIQRRKFA